MNHITLRDYQEEAIEDLWQGLFNSNSVLCVLPTGCGKTEIMMGLLHRAMNAKPELRAITLVNKVGLLEQTERRFARALGLFAVGTYCGTRGTYHVDKTLTVATIQSIYSLALDEVHVIVIDEVHNVDQDGGRYIDFINQCTLRNPKLKIIAFTATPFRADGMIYGPDKLFKRVTYRKHLPEMISRGFLVPPRMKKVDHQFSLVGLRVRAGEYRQEDVEKLTSDEKKVREQIHDALDRMGGRKKVVWACSSIKHAELVNSVLVSEGERTTCLHSKMQDDERAAAIQGFEQGDTRHMVFVSIVSEGYDYPPIDCVVLMRPIRSPVMYVQTVGRGLRPADGKVDCLVLDYGRVIESVGPLDNPALPQGRRPNASKNIVEILMKFCPTCLEYVEKKATHCPVCQYSFSQNKLSLESLTHTASDDGDILAKKPEPKIYEIENVYLKKFTSKAGNECLRIDYETNDYVSGNFSEFFVWKNHFAQKQMLKRLMDLEAPLAGTLEDQARAIPQKIPKRITVIIQDRYPRITKLEFV